MAFPNFEELKPILNSEVEIHRVSDDEYILHQKRLNHQIRVNKFSFQLISLIDGNKTINSLSKEISETLKQPVDQDTVYELLYGSLYKNGLIDNNPEAQLRNSSNYLSLRFILIPRKIVTTLSALFSFAFVGTKFFKWTILLTIPLKVYH